MRPLFIHIPKCGGMTIRHGFKGQVDTARAYLMPAYSNALYRLMIKERGEGAAGFEHARWRDCTNPPDRCFALVRNPWARVASRYMMGVRGDRANAKKKDGPPVTRSPYVPPTFEEFVEERHVWGREHLYWHRAIRGWFPAVDHVTDEDGNLRCDILRTEHLDDDVEAYLGRRPPRRRNWAQGGDAYDYRAMYDDATREAVAEWYAADIEFFGFTFEGAATRNVWCST